jgi:5'-nucleotidase
VLRLRDRRHLLPGAAAFGAALLVALLGLSAGADEPPPPPATGNVELQLLGVNDFHGHLQPPQRELGGAAWLGAHLARAARSHPGRTITVHAGDMVGASPLVSSHFHDEPAVEATNRMSFDVGTVGNHELDEGGDELLRLLRGGRRQGPAALKRQADGRLVNTSDPGWAGAGYPWLAANTVERDSGELILPPFEIVERAGVRVGFIGVTTADTPRWLLPEHRRPYRFVDISEAVNRWVPELRARGIEAIVVLAHSGALQKGAEATGEIVDEAAQMDASVDVVVAGHTHSELNLTVAGKLVVESPAYGTGYDRVTITVDRTTGDVVAKSAALARTDHAGIDPDPVLARFVEGYAERVAPLAERVVASLPRDLSEDDLGRLVADAQRAFAGADVAFVNPGNTRVPRIEAGPVTYADLFLVHAYEHPVLRLRMRGRDVLAVMEQRGPVELYTSGLEAVEPGGTYAVAVNGLLAASERFEAFGRAGEREVVGTDLEALVSRLADRGAGAPARETAAPR